jgi:hypothetical protein
MSKINIQALLVAMLVASVAAAFAHYDDRAKVARALAARWRFANARRKPRCRSRG